MDSFLSAMVRKKPAVLESFHLGITYLDLNIRSLLADVHTSQHNENDDLIFHTEALGSWEMFMR